MTKIGIWKVIIFSVILAVLANVFFGRFLSAKFSTIPALNRLGVVSPQTPIVIVQKEQVRVSDTGDVQEAVVASKSKVSAVFTFANGKVTVVGTAINLASEGLFLSVKQVFAETNAKYFVLLSDGRSAEISTLVLDPATELVFFKAGLNNTPVASFLNSQDLSVGEKLVLLSNASPSAATEAYFGLVSASQNSLSKDFEAGVPKRTFGLSFLTKPSLGQAIINTTAEFVGIWDGEKVVSSEVVKKAISLYFQNPEQIKRPKYGFKYSLVSNFESQLLKIPTGLLVTEVSLPASQRGLLKEDVIVSVNQEKISNITQVEEIFEKYKAGDNIRLEVVRGEKTLNVDLTVSELK
jgi:S1-C subfamily serine protease